MTKKQLSKQSTYALLEKLNCLHKCSKLLHDCCHAIDETDDIILLIDNQIKDIKKILHEREEMNFSRLNTLKTK